MKIALLQLPVGFDKGKNIVCACEQIGAAAKDGADMAVLPEMFCCPYASEYFREYGEEEGGPAQAALSALAKRLGVIIVGGSLPELCGDNVYNTCYVYGANGRQIARHRKTHLFDIQVEGGQHFKESATLSPGSDITLFDTPFGRMGLCICFDMRFEELARLMALAGAQAIIVPAAFNMTTGPAHWELMFRQRAVDNQLFTFGVAPARDEAGVYVSYGNTIAVDPWGSVLARCGGEEAVLVVDVDFGKVEAVRGQLPILSARRTDLYEVREKNGL